MQREMSDKKLMTTTTAQITPRMNNKDKKCERAKLE